MSLAPLFTSLKADDPTQVGFFKPSDLNAITGLLTRLFDQADADGTILVRDALSPNGASWRPPTASLATVTPALGGTGLTAYAVGDLLYASGTTALAKLPDVAIGSVLTSGGVAAAPVWRSPSAGIGLGTATPLLGLDVKASRNAGSARFGPGTSLGAPIVTPTLALNGAGVLTGSYDYAYFEKDGSGSSLLSPVGTIVASGHTVRVTVGRPRRGVGAQWLCRKNPGSGVFRVVHLMGGGYFQNVWDDNVADATVAAAALAPTVDSTGFYNLEVYEGVKFFRTHPDQLLAPADITLLTGNSSELGGCFALDAYGQIVARTYLGNSVTAFKTGTNDRQFSAYWMGLIDDGVAPVEVFAVGPVGNVWAKGLYSGASYVVPAGNGDISAEGVLWAGLVSGSGGTIRLGADSQFLMRRSNGSGTGMQLGMSFDNLATVAFTFDGNLGFSTTKAIGYGTGAGGTVTQATSKATGVTLNTVTGQITLNAASLAAGAVASFTLTSSAIAANDLLILNYTGGTAGSYTLNARAAAGSATIDVLNHTAGALAEAIVVRYAVIKAVTA